MDSFPVDGIRPCLSDLASATAQPHRTSVYHARVRSIFFPGLSVAPSPFIVVGHGTSQKINMIFHLLDDHFATVR